MTARKQHSDGDGAPKPVVAPIVVPAPAIVTLPKKLPAPAKVGDIAAAPTSTAEDNRRTAAQRDTSMIWERTHQILAVLVTAVVLGVASFCVATGRNAESAFTLLTGLVTLVVATYFQRTNHTRVGGVGKDDTGR